MHCPRHHTRLRYILLRNLRNISQCFLTLKLCSHSCCFPSSRAFACSCSAISFVLTSWKETIKLESFPRNKLTTGLNIRRHIEEEPSFRLSFAGSLSGNETLINVASLKDSGARVKECAGHISTNFTAWSRS